MSRGESAPQQPTAHDLLGIKSQQTIKAGCLAACVVFPIDPECIQGSWQPRPSEAEQFPDVSRAARDVIVKHNTQCLFRWAGRHDHGAQFPGVQLKKPAAPEIWKCGRRVSIRASWS